MTAAAGIGPAATSFFFRVPVIAAVSFLFIDALHAHPSGVGSHVVEAYRIESEDPPRIDGRLDDAVWQRAHPVRGFIQLEPVRAVPATDDTEFYIAYDPHNLYIAFRCYDAEPHLIVNRVARREQVWSSDLISFYIDPHHDHRTGYSFVATPGGVQQDAYRFDDSNRDTSWRGIWWVEGAIDELGWSVEFKIPFANFRFDATAAATWGFDVERVNMRKDEITVWKQMTQAGRLTRMSDLGHLTGLRKIGGGKSFEIAPYLLGGGSKTEGRSAGEQAATGLDVQYNLTHALKGNFTVNPDFAQVEADQLEINLTRFPTRFSEQRPFFVEGNSFFDTPFDLFYSRRVGSRGDILWGTKMTGKIGPYSVGFLGSRTGRSDVLDLGRQPELGESATFGVLRLKKDVLRRSNVGLLMATKEEENSHSRVGGVDASLALGPTYALNGQVAVSSNEVGNGDNRAMRMQVSQRNYLWDMRADLERVEPSFEVNETGFLNKEPARGWQRLAISSSYGPRWDRHRLSFRAWGHVEQSLYQDAYFTAWQESSPDRGLAAEFEEDLIGWSAEAAAGLEFTKSFWSFADVSYGRSREIELAEVFTANRYGFSVRTNGSRPVAAGLRGSKGDFFNFDRQARGRQRRVSVDGTLRPQSNVAVELEGSYAQSLDGRDEIDGRFFVASKRTTWLFTRDAFVRLFAQTERQRTDYGKSQTRRRYLFSGLFGWEYSPKSHVFVAYNEDWTGPKRSLRLDDRVVALKVSYLSNF